MLHRDLRDPLAMPGGRPDSRELLIDGDLWTVYERPPDDVDRRQSPSLVFESRSAIRRVRNYPAEWRSLSDAALTRLSWSR